MLNIIVNFDYPPIPIRTQDWCAYIDGREEETRLYGRGRTAREAVAALLQAMEEIEESEENN